MPIRNIYFILLAIVFSLFIASKTSLKEQIVRNAAQQLAKRSLEPPTQDNLYQGVLSGLASAVNDEPYTAYIPPKIQTDYMREIQGQYAGIGLGNFIKDFDSGEYYFVPLRDAPASKAGLKFGDRIVEVNGESVSTMSLLELTEKLRGEEKTTVQLKIRPRAIISPNFVSNTENTAGSSIESQTNPNAEQNAQIKDASKFQEVTITRDVVQQEIVTGDRTDKNGSWIFTLENFPDVGYISVEQFVDATGEMTIKALDELEHQGVSKVILDFRGNPGGFLGDAITICNELLSYSSPIVETRNQRGVIEQYKARRYTRRRFHVAILIDGDSASASEIVSAALQDAGVGIVVGTRSYGKGTIQSVYELPCNMGLLRVTTASFWRPSGAPIRRSRDAKPEDEWGVSPNPGYEVPVSDLQHFYTEWVRNARISSPEASAIDAQALALMTMQTTRALQSLYGVGNPEIKFEAALELGLDASSSLPFGSHQSVDSSDKESDDSSSSAAEESTNSDSLVSDTDSVQSTSKNEFPVFKPEGRAPYFDPQLDKAIDYLVSLGNEKKLDVPRETTKRNLDVD